jgi:hypothetical protein
MTYYVFQLFFILVFCNFERESLVFSLDLSLYLTVEFPLVVDLYLLNESVVPVFYCLNPSLSVFFIIAGGIRIIILIIARSIRLRIRVHVRVNVSFFIIAVCSAAF